jgi:hypothetical protein
MNQSPYFVNFLNFSDRLQAASALQMAPISAAVLLTNRAHDWQKFSSRESVWLQSQRRFAQEAMRL